MLAGKMKLKTFIVLVVGVVLVICLVCLGVTLFVPGVAAFGLYSWDAQQVVAPVMAPAERVAPAPAATPVAAPAAPAVTPAVATPAPATTPAIPVDDARPFDALLLERAGTDLGTTKMKDVTKGKTYKVNLYQDDGHTTMNRAKVDVDRDDKWDEKWTFDGTSISRKVAPADDENYTETWVWSGTEWVKE
jgi:hypothetical protein